MSRSHVLTPLRRIINFFASLKTAIPLLVFTIFVTIGGSLSPTPDFFNSWWYLSLLGLNGVSLLFITILHIPMILERKGRNALFGVVATHLGILILIGGVIYGGISGFRHEVNIIEQEVTVVPGLPFAIKLDKLVVEEYQPGEVAHLDPEVVPMKRQESYLSFYKMGELFESAIAAPAMPVEVEGFTILPAFRDIGWYVELTVLDPRGKEKAVPILPWSPPIININQVPIMAHSLSDQGEPAVQVFSQVNGEMKFLGMVKHDQPLEVNNRPIALGDSRRYTGLAIYKRPHAPVLVAGCLAMLFGLIWHFYFRHRDRNRKRKA